MAKNGFHASKGIAGTASIMAANVVRTSEAMSSVFPPFDNGARGAALPSVECPVVRCLGKAGRPRQRDGRTQLMAGLRIFIRTIFRLSLESSADLT